MMKKIATEEAIKRVLLTPLNSRVMRPEFGSKLFELIDRNFDSEFKLDAISYTYEAIEKNLPEVRIKKVDVDKNVIIVYCEDEKGELEVRVEFN
jgi:phage baseplate assembly protein W